MSWRTGSDNAGDSGKHNNAAVGQIINIYPGKFIHTNVVVENKYKLDGRIKLQCILMFRVMSNRMYSSLITGAPCLW